MSKRIYRIRTILSTYRQSVIVLFVSLSAFIILQFVYIKSVSFLDMRFSWYDLQIIAIVGGFLAAIGLFLNEYLNKKAPEINDGRTAPQDMAELKNIRNTIVHSQDSLSRQVKSIEGKIKNLQEGQDIAKEAVLSDVEKNDLVNVLRERISTTASEQYLEELKIGLSKLIDNSTSERLERHFLRTMKRLSNEIDELGRRAKVESIPKLVDI